MIIKPNLAKIIKVLFFLSIVLFILSFLAALIFGFPIKQTLRVVSGSVYVLFVPGFIWGYVFFPRKEKEGDARDDVAKVSMKEKDNTAYGSSFKRTERVGSHNHPLDLIERITLSFALSMAMGPLLIFFLNKIGIKINFLNSFLELLVLIIAGLVIIFLQEKRKTAISRYAK